MTMLVRTMCIKGCFHTHAIRELEVRQIQILPNTTVQLENRLTDTVKALSARKPANRRTIGEA
jgi:hypothetical protein